MTKFAVVPRVENGIFLGVRHAPNHEGSGAKHPKIFWDLPTDVQ